jgi:prevent-host-death family protein
MTRKAAATSLSMWPPVAISSSMTTVSIRDAKNRLTELARRVERGETIVVTRSGKPILDLVPHRPKGGLNLDAIAAYKREHGVDRIVTFVADDFDAPLPEDFLLKPLP